MDSPWIHHRLSHIIPLFRASPWISTVPTCCGTGRNISSGGSSAGPRSRKRSRSTRAPQAKSASETNNSCNGWDGTGWDADSWVQIGN